MTKISMYVMAHKRFDVPDSEIYIPLQVGAALHDDLGFLRDDAGDNISTKNPNYSELTGVYHVWKNDRDSDIVGICHYRRFFADENLSILDEKGIGSILENADIIVPQPAMFPKTLIEDYVAAHNAADIEETRKAIEKLYPDYLETFDEFMDGHLLYYANMMIARKSTFDAYCKWLFDILFEVEKNLDISGYDDYNKRVFGFISERLLGVWIKKNNLKAATQRVITVGDKAESVELVKWGVECIERGEFDRLIEKYDERRANYADLFLTTSDASGFLNELYDLAVEARDGDGHIEILKILTKRYLERNYHLEYIRCMLDVREKLKPQTVILGEDHALYGVDFGELVDAVPLAMTAQDVLHDYMIFERAAEFSGQSIPGENAADPAGQSAFGDKVADTIEQPIFRCCILVAQDGMLYDKTEQHPAGANVKAFVYDVLFGDAPKQKSIPWQFVPEGLPGDEDRLSIETACRKTLLKKGGFFNDLNPRGRNMSVTDPTSYDIHKSDLDAKNIFYENRAALEKLAGKCAEGNTRFVVVVPPCRSDSDNARRRELRTELLDVLEELPYPVEYQDLNSQVWEGIFFDEDFYNAEYLNESGAKKFTQVLNELSALQSL